MLLIYGECQFLEKKNRQLLLFLNFDNLDFCEGCPDHTKVKFSMINVLLAAFKLRQGRKVM
jgi:hypothetical protein